MAAPIAIVGNPAARLYVSPEQGGDPDPEAAWDPSTALSKPSSNWQYSDPYLGTVTFNREKAGPSPPGSWGETDNCSNTGCDSLLYGFVIDGYVGRPLGSCRTSNSCPEYANTDLMHPVWKDGGFRHTLIKDVHVKNAFKNTSDPHVDLLQTLDAPGYNGWIVIQDSEFWNSDDGHLQMQSGGSGDMRPSTMGGQSRTVFGGAVFQNVKLHQQSAFNADCVARGTNSDGCGLGNYYGSNDPGTTWLINYDFGNVPITLQQTHDKVVLVWSLPGSAPTLQFRGSTPGFNFSTNSPCTGSPCSYSNRVWGPYDSIEDAIAAGHDEPPFVRLSCSGWASPPAGCYNGRTLFEE